MVIEMLKAVSQMLIIPDTDTPQQAGAKVDCAKLMLDGIIMGMEKEPITMPIVSYPPISAHSAAEEKVEKKWYCTKDAKDSTFKIVGTPPLGTQIELDGTVYPWKEAIGKKFVKGKIVE